MEELDRLDRAGARGRVIIAHLGNGASLTAVSGGRSIDTTMGFSPTGGVMMGTRTGDLDPGVLLYALQAQRMDPEAVNRLVNHDGGLLGVSETSYDMRDLLEHVGTDPRAADAVALFCYLVKKAIGALAAALGGIETLVFTAGIGEHSAQVRGRICEGLGYLGLQIDSIRNDAHDPVISRDGSPVVIRVLATDEDRMLARHARRLILRSDDV
jgi:acetate kinase